MTNALTKDTRVIERIGVQAQPPRPAMPARTIYASRHLCGFGVSYIANLATGEIIAVNLGTDPSVYACADVIVPLTIPATPPFPGSPGTESGVVVDYHLGWNGGARSVGFFRDDGDVEFKVRASAVGVICGCNVADGVDAHYVGANIDYAFSCGRGLWRIVQNGVTVAGAAGAYDDTTVFHVGRSGTDIVYKVAGSTVHTTTGGTSDDLFLEAALYSGGDQVFDPVIHQTTTPDLTAQTADMDVVLPPLTTGMFQGLHCSMDVTLPPLGGPTDGSSPFQAGLAAPNYSIMAASLPYLYPITTSLTGELGTMDVTLPPLNMLMANRPYAEMRTSLPALTGSPEGGGSSFTALEGNLNASMQTRASVSSSMAGMSMVGVTMRSDGTISDVWGFGSAQEATMRSDGYITIAFSVNAIMSASMTSFAHSGWVMTFPGSTGGTGSGGSGGGGGGSGGSGGGSSGGGSGGGSGSSGADSDTQTFVFNVDSNGNTTYTNFGFNSYMKLGGRYFAASVDGIFELAGDTDDGEPIRSRLGFGRMDFGSISKKTVEAIYLGMSAKGHLYVKVISEGCTYTYRTEDFSAFMQQQRVKLGKGMKPNYIDFEIYNADGADFDIDSVVFRLADLSRKVN